MMTFEEWWESRGDSWHWTEDILSAEQAWEAGIQEGIDRMYKLYDICPECRCTEGQHKMDCGRGR